MGCCIAEIFTSAVAENFADCTVEAIGRELCYIFQYESNKSNLQTETENLNREKKKMKDLVDDAIRKGDEIFETTKKWQEDAEEISRQAREFLEDENHANIRWCSLRGLLLLNLVPRYQLSKKAKEMGESVVQIKVEVNYENISRRPHLQTDFANKDYINFDSRNEIVDGVLEALGDDNTRMIGVHGMPGAGKTTLVKEVSRRALELTLFSEAVLVTVSNTPDVEKIQKAIAERLDLQLDKETIPERALLLRNRLQQEKKLLIILDDVWNKINLKDVGIVFKSDEKGCKILFTSRFERLMSEKMSVEKIFQVGLLEEDEAMNWFSGIVAKTVEKYSECASRVNDIVKECARLPIAIETIAHTLKGHEPDFWDDILQQLRKSTLSNSNADMQVKVYNSIELCFKDLYDTEAYSLLVYCGFHNEDESIRLEDLMLYGMGLGMFQGVDTFQGARKRVKSLVDELQDRCLLLKGDYLLTVKMHDVIRDVVISIARKSHMYCFTNDTEVRYLESEVLEKSKAILLHNGYVPQLLRGGLEYKQLKFLVMCQNRASQSPDDFLKNTKNLRVLYLVSYQYLEKLPSSLSSLGNLCLLRLCCNYLEDISSIGGLKNLEILELSGCGIKELPREVGQLACLRMLGLRGCTELEVIQPDVISNLKSLEELYVVESFKDWDGQVEGVNGEQRNASLNELKHLDQLTTLHLDIVDIKVLPKDLFRSIKLEQYQISIGCEWSGQMIIDNPSRCLELSLDDNKPLKEYGLEMLLPSTRALYLKGLQGAHTSAYQFGKSLFRDLKSFQLENKKRIQCLVNLTEQNHPWSVFGNLEILHLDSLEILEKICDWELTKESFKRLRIIKVINCNGLKNLLPFSMSKLVEIEITDCRMMEEMVSDHEEEEEEEEDKSKEVIGDFPQLSSLKLENVPRLKSFRSKLKKIQRSEKGKQPMDVDHSVTTLLRGKVAFPSLKNLNIDKMSKLKMIANNADVFRKLEEIDISECNKVMKIFASGMQRALGSLRRLDIERCDMVEEVFEIQALSFEEITHDTISAQLISLRLSFLPKLRYVWGKDPQGTITFTHLEDVEASNCPSLKSIFPLSIAKGLSKLQKLSLPFCGIEQIIEAVGTVPAVPPEFVFPRLEVMKLECMENLVGFYSGLHTSSWPSLTTLKVDRCKKVKVLASELSFFQEKHVHHDHDNRQIPQVPLFFTKFDSFPNLENLELLDCNLEKIWDGELLPNSRSFRKLTSLDVRGCWFLKNLFSSGVAANFKQLRSLKIVDCEMIEEIMSKNEKVDKVQFTKLERLNFYNLPNLVSFSTEIFIEFPSLTEVSIDGKDCPKFKSFVSILEEKDCTTITSLFNDKVAFPSLQTVEIKGLVELKMIWQYKPSTADSFSKLEDVKVINCNNLVKIFPSSMQRRLHNLKWLKISDCEMVEELFDIQIMPNVEGTYNIIPSQLIHLSLVGLSKLKYVWSKDPQGTLTFPHLKHVIVEFCPSLESIFRPSIAKGLFQLQKLYVVRCGIEYIVAKEEELETVPPKFQFPQLEKITLLNLINFVSFYQGLHTTSFPLLATLIVSECMKLKVIASEFFNVQETHGSMDMDPPYFNRDGVALKLEGLPNLMHLMDEYCSQGHTTFQNFIILLVLKCNMLKNLVASSISFQNLEELTVSQCHGIINLVSSQTAKSMNRLRKMRISHCQRLTEIISDRLEGDHDTEGGEIVFSGLKSLEIDRLPSLTSFNSGKYMMGFPELENVVVSGCFEMQSFSVHGIISTPKLNELQLDGKTTMRVDNNTTDINSIIKHHFKNQPDFCLAYLFAESSSSNSEHL